MTDMNKQLLVCLISALVFATPSYAASTDSCNDADTVLALHADGVDASTTFTDSSTSGKTVTANGNAQIDTAQYKFATASGLFDGTDDFLSTPDHADFQFGSGDFTIDMWVRWNSLPSDTTNQALFSKWNVAGSDKEIVLYINNTSGTYTLYSLWSANGTSLTEVISGASFAVSTGVWYHVAVIRSGTSGMLFIDGTQSGSTTDVTGFSMYDGAASVYVGNIIDDGFDFNGWMDEVRIVKGTAVWTTTFTAPAAAYEDTCVSARRRQGQIVGD